MKVEPTLAIIVWNHSGILSVELHQGLWSRVSDFATLQCETNRIV
jgi:hypothetical protein